MFDARRKRFVPVPGSLGLHNPITDPWNGTWNEIKDPIISRAASTVAYSPMSPLRNGCWHYGSFDPIKSDWIVEPEDQQRKSTVGYVNFKSKAKTRILFELHF